MRPLLPLIVLASSFVGLAAVSGCDPLRDDYDARALACGGAVAGGDAVLLRFTDGAGDVPGDALEASWRADGADAETALDVTPKGCVVLPAARARAGRLAVRSKVRPQALARLLSAEPLTGSLPAPLALGPIHAPFAVWRDCGDWATSLEAGRFSYYRLRTPKGAALTSTGRAPVAARLDPPSAPGVRALTLPLSERGCLAVPTDAVGFVSVFDPADGAAGTVQRRAATPADTVTTLDLVPAGDARGVDTCGVAPATRAPGTALVKVVAEDLSEVSAADGLAAFLAGADGRLSPALPLTSRGCVVAPLAAAARPDQRLVARLARKGARTLAAVAALPSAATATPGVVRLLPFAPGSVVPLCPAGPIYTNQPSLALPLKGETPAGSVSEVVVAASLVDARGAEKAVARSWLPATGLAATLPLEGVADGRYQLHLSTLAVAGSGLAEGGPVAATCDVRVTHVAPTIQAGAFTPVNDVHGDAQPTVMPGQAIQLVRDDPTGGAATYEACLLEWSDERTPPDRSACRPEPVGTTLPAPDHGTWTLLLFAHDPAGNRSAAAAQTFSVFHRAEINELRARADQAMGLYVAGDHLGALVKALAAESERRALPLGLEREGQADYVWKRLLGVGANVRERTRLASDDYQPSPRRSGWSADGRTFFVRWVTSTTLGHYGLWSVDEGVERTLGDEGDHLETTPDGRYALVTLEAVQMPAPGAPTSLFRLFEVATSRPLGDVALDAIPLDQLFTPDGARLVVGLPHALVTLTVPALAQAPGSPRLFPADRTLRALEMSRRGGRLLLDFGGTAQIVDPVTGEGFGKDLPLVCPAAAADQAPQPASGVHWSGSGDWLAVVCDDAVYRVSLAGEPLGKLLDTPNNRTVVTSADDSTVVSVVNTPAGQPGGGYFVRNGRPPSTHPYQHELALSPTGLLLFGQQPDVRGNPVSEVVESDGTAIASSAGYAWPFFAPDESRHLLAVPRTDGYSILDLDRTALPQRTDHETLVRDVAVSADGSRVVTARGDRVELLDGELTLTSRCRVGDGYADKAAVLGPGRYAVAGGAGLVLFDESCRPDHRVVRAFPAASDGAARLVERLSVLDAGRLVAVTLVPWGGPAANAAEATSAVTYVLDATRADASFTTVAGRLVPDATGARAVVVTGDGGEATAQVVTAADGRLTGGASWPLSGGRGGGLPILAFTDGGRSVGGLFHERDPLWRVWDATTGALRRSSRITTQTYVPFDAFEASADGRQLLVTGTDGVVTAWDVSGSEARKEGTPFAAGAGHGKPAAHFLAQGVAILGADGGLTLGDLRCGCKKLDSVPLRVRPSGLGDAGLAVGPDGRTLFAFGSQDKTVRLLPGTLDEARRLACKWVRPYLRSAGPSELSDDERHVCDGVP